MTGMDNPMHKKASPPASSAPASSAPASSSNSSSSSDVPEESDSSPSCYISELSIIFHVVCFVGTLLVPLLCLLYAFSLVSVALTSEVFFSFLPLGMACFILSVGMAPLRLSRTRLLYVQYFLLGFASEVACIVGDVAHDQPLGVRNDVVRLLLVWVPFGAIFFKTREYLGRLPGRQLEEFLVNTVLLQGTSELVPILFLSISSLRCVIRFPSELVEEVCRKNSLIHMFLGFYLVIFMFISLVTKAVPSHVLVVHSLTPASVLSLTLSGGQVLQCFCGLLTVCSALFLLANMDRGSSGTTSDPEGEVTVNAVGFLGGVALMAVVLWKGFQVAVDAILDGDLETDEDDKGGGDGQGAVPAAACAASSSFSPSPSPSPSPPPPPRRRRHSSIAAAVRSRIYTHTRLAARPPPTVLEECSWVYVFACWGVSLSSPTLAGVYMLTPEKAQYCIYCLISIPVSAAFLALAVFLKPKREDVLYKTALFGNFLTVTYLTLIFVAIGDAQVGDFNYSIMIMVIVVLISIAFVFALKFRSIVSQMSPESLTIFISETLLKNGPTYLAPVVYCSFIALRCVTGSSSACTVPAYAHFFISTMLVMRMSLLFALSAVHPDARERAVVRLSRVAVLRLTRGEAVSGTAVGGACVAGTFLFSKLIRGGGEDEEDMWIIVSSGLSGCGLLAIASIWQITRLLRKEGNKKDKSEYQRASDKAKNDVTGDVLCTEISWVFVILSFLLTLANPALTALYMVTLDWRWITYSVIVLPICINWYALSCFMKPRRKDRFYLMFMRLHFAVFVFPSLVFVCIGDFRRGETVPLRTIMGGIVAVSACVALYFAMRIRSRFLTKLSDVELSEFLTQHLLFSGIISMFPLVFFALDTWACVSQNIDHPEACDSTAACQFFLSSYLIAIGVFQIMVKSAPAELRANISVTPQKAATFELTKTQKGEAACVSVTGLCALYLFGNFGTASMEPVFFVRTVTVGIIGMAAIFTFLLAVFVDLFMVGEKAKQPQDAITLPSRPLLKLKTVSFTKKESGFFGDLLPS